MSGGEQPIGVPIVDDEGPARTGLREILSRMPGVQVLAECENGFDAVRAAAESKPDAVFLDIEMPKLNGFEVLELLDPAIAVVFVTAYDEYAVRAFEVSPVDYVLKPYREERIREALSGPGTGPGGGKGPTRPDCRPSRGHPDGISIGSPSVREAGSTSSRFSSSISRRPGTTPSRSAARDARS